MRTGILTRWPVVQERALLPGDVGLDRKPTEDALRRWLAEAWEAYLDRCADLRTAIRERRASVDVGPLRLGRCREVEPGAGVLIATAMTELRSSSFDMAIRIRALGSDIEPVADGRYSVVMRFDPTDSAVATLRIRRELLAVEAAAFDYC